MGQQTFDGDDLTRLRTAYRRRVNGWLPQAARCAGDWPIQADHCFARVVLDAVFDDVWYDHVDDRPAIKQLAAADLRQAIAIAEWLLRKGRPAVVTLHERSLRWREPD
jgi:hypothetical protein